MRKPSLLVFDRSGRRLATLSIDVGKRQVIMPNRRQITIFGRTTSRQKPRIGFTTYNLDGSIAGKTNCAVPSGYPARAMWPFGFDGRLLRIGGLINEKRAVYRDSFIDTHAGTVIHDIEHGLHPYFDEWVQPGLYINGIAGGPDGIYAVDPDTGKAVRLTQLSLYDQEGYENHANSQFATDLVFGGKGQ